MMVDGNPSKPSEHSLSGTLRALWMLLRPLDYIPAFTLTGLYGSLLTFRELDNRILWLTSFIASSSATAFIVNDISDRRADSNTGSSRNPISLHLISVRSAATVATATLLTSILSLIMLPARLAPMGLIALFISLLYSQGIRAKDRPVLDVLFHAAVPALYVAMGYSAYEELDTVGVILAMIAASLSAMAELLQEVRDYEADRGGGRVTTTMLLGRTLSLKVSAALLGATLTTIVVLSLVHSRYHWVLPLTPLSLILILPMVRVLKGEEPPDGLPRKLNKRGIILALILLLALLMVRSSG